MDCCFRPSTPYAHFRCSSCRSLASPHRERCYWPSEGCCCYSGSSGSSCSARTGYSRRTSAGTGVHSARGSVPSHRVAGLRGRAGKEEVSAVLPLLLVGSTSRLLMAGLRAVLVSQGTASRLNKQGLRIISGMPRNCQPLPRVPGQPLFGASIWFCEEKRGR